VGDQQQGEGGSNANSGDQYEDVELAIAELGADDPELLDAQGQRPAGGANADEDDAEIQALADSADLLFARRSQQDGNADGAVSGRSPAAKQLQTNKDGRVTRAAVRPTSRQATGSRNTEKQRRDASGGAWNRAQVQ
jgi:hypothetical protein